SAPGAGYAQGMRKSVRARIALVGVSLIALTVAGCSEEPLLDPRPGDTAPPAPADPSADPAPTDPEEPAGEEDPGQEPAEPTEPTIATVPGYAVGEFPAVPMFVLPDLALIDDELTADATRDLRDDLEGLTGVSVAPAHCGEDGRPTPGIQTSLLYGDRDGDVVAPDGTEANYGTGAGTLTVGGETA